MLFKYYTDKPDAPSNVRIPPEDIKHDSFIVQWDAVTDVFPINYTIRWYGEDINNTATTNEPLYRITGLTSNTSYSVTVVAINTCCGTGPVSDVAMATTMFDNVTATTISVDIIMATASTSPTNNITSVHECFVFGLLYKFLSISSFIIM